MGQVHWKFFDSQNFSKLLMAALYRSQVLEALEAAMSFPQTPCGQSVKPDGFLRYMEYLLLPEQPSMMWVSLVLYIENLIFYLL